LGLDKHYAGQTKPDGTDFLVETGDSGRRPFYVLLDVGLHYTTTGARVFGAMKGAVDGGLEIPHKNKRFPGYNTEAGKFDAAVLRKYIFGGHVADYMRQLQASDPEKYKKQFSRYLKAGKGPDDVEKMWQTVHSNIRSDPAYVKVTPKANPKRVKNHRVKLNAAQRKNRVNQKLAAAGKMTQ
jgi:large subunit ribosomal protein L5e